MVVYGSRGSIVVSTKLVCTLTSTRVMGLAGGWGAFVWGAFVWGAFVWGAFVWGGLVWGGFDLLTTICFVGFFCTVLPRLLDDLGLQLDCFFL